MTDRHADDCVRIEIENAGLDNTGKLPAKSYVRRRTIGSTIRRVLARTRTRLYSLTPTERTAARFKRTMEKNDLNAFQTMYANPKYVKLYLDPQRLSFYEHLADTIAKFVDFSHADLTYLDVGCGTGHLMDAIRRRGMAGTITGCDYAATALTVVKEVCPGAQFEVRDVYTLGITSSYDFITCCETLEHLKYPEQAISNMLAAIKPGGKLFLTVPDGRKDTWAGHIHFWSPESFALLLEKFGRSETLYVDDCNFGVLFK